jgi:hypothetical protein
MLSRRRASAARPYTPTTGVWVLAKTVEAIFDRQYLLVTVCDNTPGGYSTVMGGFPTEFWGGLRPPARVW